MIHQILNFNLKIMKKVNNKNKYLKQKERLYEISCSKFFSRKISFFPEFLNVNLKSQISKNQKKFKIQNNNKIKEIFMLFYMVIFFKKFLINCKAFPVFLMIYTEEQIFSWHFYFLISAIVIFSNHTLYLSKPVKKNFIAFLFFFLISCIGKFISFYQKKIGNFFLVFFGDILIMIIYWHKKIFIKNIKNKYSDSVLLFRETRCFITTFSLLRFFYKLLLVFYLYSEKSFNLMLFLINQNYIISIDKFFKIFNSLFLLKFGGNFIFIFIAGFFLCFEIFAYNYLGKKKFRSLFFFYFFFKKKFLVIKYFFNTDGFFFFNPKLLFIDEKKKNKKDFVFENYFLNNLDLKKKKHSWNTKKAGITIPFVISFWNNEIPFIKKKLEWEIKTKKNL
jgi:hypothetical protein